MKKKYLILFSLSGLVLVLDQLTKLLALKNLVEGVIRPLIPGLLSLSLEKNNGFAFGLLKKAPEAIQSIFFIAVPIFALVLIILIFIKLRDDQMLTSVALTSILGGAIGNLIDRVQYGHVIDFIGLSIGGKPLLAPLNVADFAIMIGVALMFVSTFKKEDSTSYEKK